MVEEILTAAGLEHRQGRFIKPPAETYAVYFDDVDVDGPDPLLSGTTTLARICRHDVRIELYEPKPDPNAEAALEAQLDARGVPWTKEDRYWLDDAQRYQVLFEFTYTTKRR